MAKKKKAEPSEGTTVSAERAARLYRLVQLLSAAPQSRASLLRRLGLNIRGFYRDLEALRLAGIEISRTDAHYILDDEPQAALDRLPFPDPGLSFGEARQLAKGRGKGHKKIQQQLAHLEE
jgi:biotin operon repressor